MTRICCNKGTKIIDSDLNTSNWFVNNKNIQSRISLENNGPKITSSKGTKSLWIRQLPKIETVPSLKVVIHNRGTKRLEQIF
jgi:hypothetical protein